ncbi:MAG TPA: hypothetical protein VFY10_07290 [Dehalococcoidia bacterium]|nr:hypothetical protein [Dehalococcoidia bacterium]
MALSVLGKAVLGAAFLLLAACSGGDSFKANPNAVVDSSQLGPMIATAAAPQGLTQVSTQTLPLPGDTERSCNDVGLGCNPFGSPPGLDVIYKGSDGSSAIVEVLVEPETLDAKNMMQSRAETVQIASMAMMDPSSCTAGRLCGACDAKAVFNSDQACAYSEYNAPKVGDHVLAYASDAIQGRNAAAVFFARDFLVGRVEVTAPTVKAAQSEANRLATALDEQMKQTLSQ